MKQTTFILNKPVTVADLRRVIEVEKQVTAALESLGYNLDKLTVTIKPCAFGRYRVGVGMHSIRVGIWDVDRKTFVD